MDDLEREISNNGTLRDIAEKLVTDYKKGGKWIDRSRRLDTEYLINPNKISPKGKWDFEGVTARAKIKLKQEKILKRYEEYNEIRTVNGKERKQIPSHVTKMQTEVSQYDLYVKRHKRLGLFKDGISKFPLSRDKWTQLGILQNLMRATSIRIDLLMRVVQEACKRSLAKKKKKKASHSAAMATNTIKMKVQKAKQEELHIESAESLESTVDIDLSDMINLKLIHSVFPIHQENARLWLKENWAVIPLDRMLRSANFWLCWFVAEEKILGLTDVPGLLSTISATTSERRSRFISPGSGCTQNFSTSLPLSG
eukprot:766872-Hanusia_phi.AAC.1